MQIWLISSVEHALIACAYFVIAFVLSAHLRDANRRNPVAVGAFFLLLFSAICNAMRSALHVPWMAHVRYFEIGYGITVGDSTLWAMNAILAGLAVWLMAYRAYFRAFADLNLAHDLEESNRVLKSGVATLMQGFLTEHLPEVPNLKFDVTYRPASVEADVGGDWYDVFTLPDGKIAVSLGDVAGHGIEAAVTMGRLKQSIMTAAIIDRSSPATILERVNRILGLHEGPPMVTAFFGIIDPSTFRMVYASAGHHPPFVAESNGSVWSLPADGFPLGIEPEIHLREYTVEIKEHSMLALFTDGLIEYNHDILAGEERLRESIKRVVAERPNRPAHAITNLIFTKEFPRDDVALLTITFGVKMEQVPDLEIILPAQIENAAIAREAVSDFMERHHFTADEAFSTLSAAGEAIINVCEHAYRNEPTKGELVVRGYLEGQVLVLEVEDDGRWTKAVEMPTDPLDERGRGLMMMHMLTDSVIFWSKIPNGGTIVRLTKTIQSVAQAPPQEVIIVAA